MLSRKPAGLISSRRFSKRFSYMFIPARYVKGVGQYNPDHLLVLKEHGNKRPIVEWGTMKFDMTLK